jgi:hypothetical protein
MAVGQSGAAFDIAGGDVLRQYTMRFARNSEEEVQPQDFDTTAFKWDIEQLLAEEQLQVQKRSFSGMGDEPIRPGRQLHFTIPMSVKQKLLGTHVPSMQLASQMKAAPLVSPLKGSIPKSLEEKKLEAASPLGLSDRRGQPARAKFQSIPLPGGASAKALASRSYQGAGQNPSAKFGSLAVPVPSRRLEKDNLLQHLDAESPCQQYDLDGHCETHCARCRLPMGDFGYPCPDGKGMIHGECMARQVLQELENEDSRRRLEDENRKMLRRTEYGIGWKVERIPRNFDLQQRLQDMVISQGMCCVVLQEGSKSIRLAPTLEPSAAVNLEYLCLALQVRRKDGREPLFSLDPVHREDVRDDENSKEASQVKRFEPEWLAGTSVGEVLFQADYHLKELSMGEYEQPVVGMKSIFDLCKSEEDYQQWRAREWFMVRNAEVFLSEDNVLIPQVKMGVEAREQLYTQSGLDDAPITREDHPMVKYAESFSKNFDLIAERKSVVYHLRELAKASVLAKFLVDAGVAIEEDWLNLAGEVEEACSLEIPQLWNERVQSKIRVQDGEVMGVDRGIRSNLYGIYGGVSFGLDKFDISRVAPLKAAPVKRTDAVSARMPAGPPTFGAVALPTGS